MKGFTLVELIIATTLSLFIALSTVFLINTSFRAIELNRKKIDERKLDYLIYILQKQLIGCHNIEFKEGITYTTASGLTGGFVKVFFDANKEGILYREYDWYTGELLYSYRLPAEASISYDGRKAIRLLVDGRTYIIFLLCAENMPALMGR